MVLNAQVATKSNLRNPVDSLFIFLEPFANLSFNLVFISWSVCWSCKMIFQMKGDFAVDTGEVRQARLMNTTILCWIPPATKLQQQQLKTTAEKYENGLNFYKHHNHKPWPPLFQRGNVGRRRGPEDLKTSSTDASLYYCHSSYHQITILLLVTNHFFWNWANSRNILQYVYTGKMPASGHIYVYTLYIYAHIHYTICI